MHPMAQMMRKHDMPYLMLPVDYDPKQIGIQYQQIADFRGGSLPDMEIYRLRAEDAIRRSWRWMDTLRSFLERTPWTARFP